MKGFFQTLAVLCLMAFGFIGGAFTTQWNDRAASDIVSLANPGTTEPWYWNLPGWAWLIVGILLLVLLLVCQLAASQAPTTKPPHILRPDSSTPTFSQAPQSDGPVK